jgi:allantoin racemase
MTEKIGEAARRAAGPMTEIVAVNPEGGPVSIEGHYDEAVSVLGVLEEVRKGEARGVDGYVIACFGDPGLLAAREIARGPVIGIAEAAMHVASFIATGFSVVTTLSRTCIMAEHLVERYGMRPFCRKVRGTDIPVLALEETGSATLGLLIEECRRAVAEDRCGAIVLGCAGMADLVATVQREVGVPVIDGVAAAVKLVEALVGLGLGTSKRGDLAWPEPKSYTGSLAHLAPTARS